MNNSNVRSISVLVLLAVNIIFTLSVFLNCKKEINHLKQEDVENLARISELTDLLYMSVQQEQERYDKALVITRLNSILITEQVRIIKGKETAFNIFNNINRRFDNIGSDYRANLDSIILYN